MQSYFTNIVLSSRTCQLSDDYCLILDSCQRLTGADQLHYTGWGEGGDAFRNSQCKSRARNAQLAVREDGVGGGSYRGIWNSFSQRIKIKFKTSLSLSCRGRVHAHPLHVPSCPPPYLSSLKTSAKGYP